jgi:YVTN family beta-propeller protein
MSRLIRAVTFGSVLLGLSFATLLNAQTSGPLVYIQNIPVPGWTNTGTTQANLDIFGFNPYNRALYIADRTNHAVTVIDTISNSVAGQISIPGAPNTNGAMIATNLQKLVVTDGKTNVFVYDLRVPSPPDAYNLPGVGGGTDALDYDPLNQTVYVINGTAPYYMTGIDLVNRKIRSQLQLPASPELMRFNPNDGLIYQAITDGDNAGKAKGLYVYDPVANTITAKTLTTDCTPHGVEIDPISNVLLLGCSPGGQVMIDLNAGGKIINTFTNQTGTDLTAFNPNTLNFYTGAGSNNIASTGCPKDSAGNNPVIGVYSAPGTGQANQVGLQCTGRAAKGPGVNPFDNFVYAGTRQYPVDPNDATTGQSGVLVYWDPSPRMDARPGQSAPLSTLDGKSSLGTVQFSNAQRRGLRATGTLRGVPSGSATLVIPTSIGNEAVSCYANTDGSSFCDGPLLGSPLIGAPALLGVNGAPAGKGKIQ